MGRGIRDTTQTGFSDFSTKVQSQGRYLDPEVTLEMRLGGEVGAELSISRRELLSMGVIPSYSPAEHAHGGSRLDFRNGALLRA